MKNTRYLSWLRSLSLLCLWLLILPQPMLADSSTVANPEVATSTDPIFLPLITNSQAVVDNGESSERRMYGYSDASVLLPASFDTQFLTAQKSLMCLPPTTLPLELTFEQSITSLWQKLERKVGSVALNEFRSDLRFDSLSEAQSFAIASLLNRQLEGAIAGYLQANDHSPNDALLLINAAGALTTAGLHNEALAFLNRADAIRSQTITKLGTPLGIPGEELAINNRGAALLGLGQWAQAEDVLRPLAEGGIELAEARTNLSVALLCQDKDDEAAKWYRLGTRRKLYDTLPPTPPEIEGTRLPPKHTFDRNVGKIPTIPNLVVAATPAQARGLLDYYQTMFDKHIERLETINAQIEENSRLRSEAPLPSPISLKRFAMVQVTAMRVEHEPDIAPLYTEANRLQEELQLLKNDVGDRIDTASETLLGEEFKTECRAALLAYWGQWVPKFAQYETTMRNYIELKYVAATATVAHLSNDLNHEYVSLEIEKTLENDFEFIRVEAQSHNRLGAVWWPVCDAPEPPPAVLIEAPAAPRAAKCPATWANGKFQLEVLAGVAVKANCEQVEIEVNGSAMVTPFASFTADLKNQTYTLFAGAKTRMSTPSGELAVNTGAYIRCNQEGISDIGMKWQPGAQAGIGELSYGIETDVELGIAAAYEYLSGQ